MSNNNLAREKFEEGMADFVGHNFGRSIDLLSDLASEDIQMVTRLSEVNIESFANENNVWRSQHLRLESMYDDDLTMER